MGDCQNSFDCPNDRQSLKQRLPRAWLVWMDDTGGTGADAATEFLSSHGDVWKAWVSDDIAASVSASL